MPVITISKIADRTKTSSRGKKYKVVTVEGTKYGSEEEWSTDIFKNDTVVIDQLEEFGPGNIANFKFIKNGSFWDLKTIEEPTAELLKDIDSGEFNTKPKKTSNGSRKSTGGTTNSNKMSKDEWAAKDQATKESIARAVAIKLAMDNTKVGTASASIIKQAMDYIPFLMGEDEILFDKVQSPEDVLDPPMED